MSSQLIKLDQAKQLLAECSAVDEAKDIRDMAIAAQHYAKVKALGIDAEVYANEIKALATRRMGEILREQIDHDGGRPTKNGNTGSTVSAPTLADIGVTKNESSLAQAVAALPETAFAAMLAKAKANKKPLSDNDLRRATKKHKTIQREAQSLSDAPAGAMWTITDDQSVVTCDLLITDPPYGILDERWEPNDLKAFTLDWLTRWNECEADLILPFFSQAYMWDGRQWFDAALTNYEFQQTLIWHYPNNKSPQSRHMFKQTWEPIFVYRQRGCTRQIGARSGDWAGGFNDFDCHVAAVPQTNFNDVNFKQHPAQKPLSVMTWLINAIAMPGELICDPFCGSGTTGIAATKLACRFYGIESDPTYMELAKKRLAAYGE